MPFDREQRDSVTASKTIVRRLAGSPGPERFCVLNETSLPAAGAFVFTCVGGACAANGLTMAEVCDLLITAGIPEREAYLLLDEARAGYRDVQGG